MKQRAVYSLLSPSTGEEKEKEKEETFSFVSSFLRLSSYRAEAEETAAASGKECHDFDTFNTSALYF